MSLVIKPKLNLQQLVNDIFSKTIEDKKIFLSFLENFIIIDDKAINDYIAIELWKMENELTFDNPNYTYWVDGGLSWFYWFYWYNNSDKFNEIDSSIMSISNFKINYVINNEIIWKDKTKHLYNLLKKVQELLKSKGINTKIITTNFTFENDMFNFTYNTKTLFKEPNFNIKLVIDNTPLAGGSKFKRIIKKPKEINPYFIKAFKTVLNVKPEVIDDKILRQKLTSEFNNKTIVEINLDYYHTIIDPARARILNIKTFNEKYVNVSIIRGYHPLENYQTVRQKLNKLNELGLLTFSYINTTKTEDEMGLNVDKYRQNKFIEVTLENNKEKIKEYYEKILETYQLVFKDFKSFNVFFIKKIKEIITKNSDVYYGEFMDYIEKWFVSKFRNSINSCIIEINNDLAKYGVKLFIAGGDAMRRYKNDISFTKDIDTKLYINNIQLDSGKTKEDIKNEIIEIIIKNIVKLRNYLEENRESILNEIIKDKEPLSFIKYTSETANYIVKTSLNEETKSQQFRTREIKKTDNFPVDLYSIDFRTAIEIYDKSGVFISETTHDISLLDIVLQDNDDYKDYYIEEFGDIPIASLDFLLEDFEKTYTTNDRALARISSDKVKKDIIRYNILYDIYEKSKKEGGLDKSEQNIIIPNAEELLTKLSREQINKKVKQHLLFILNKFLHKEQFNIMDFILIIKLLLHHSLIINEYPQLKDLFNKLTQFKVNMFNEKLNIIDGNYMIYNDKASKNKVVQIYHQLFSSMCFANDELKRHIIPFVNNRIVMEYNKLFPQARITLAKSNITSKSTRNIKRKNKSSSNKSTLKPSKKIKKNIKKTSSSLLDSHPKTPTNSPPPLPPPPPLPDYPQPPLPRLRRRVTTKKAK